MIDELQYDEAILKQLLDGDIDEPLAKHIAHMFIRDPHQVKFGFFVRFTPRLLLSSCTAFTTFFLFPFLFSRNGGKNYK